jgi:hypothetical protein
MRKNKVERLKKLLKSLNQNQMSQVLIIEFLKVSLKNLHLPPTSQIKIIRKRSLVMKLII